MSSDLDRFLVSVKECLETSSPLGPFTIEEAKAWSKKQKIDIPCPDFPKPGSEEASHLTLQYGRPTSINVVGGYAGKSCLSPSCADLIVEMGPEGVKEKDHLNYRFFYKKAFYLAAIWQALKKAKLLEGFVASFEVKNQFKPVLVIQGAEFSVKILPFSTVFKAFRLAPGRNSVRGTFFAAQHGTEAAGDEPTPMVNSTILSDMLYNEHAKSFRSATKQIPGLPSALKMCKAWLRQRSYETVVGGLSSFHLTMLLVLMTQQELVDSSMDELQILKAALKFIGNLDFTKPLQLARSTIDEVPSEYKEELSLSAFAKHFQAIFMDSTGYLNLFWDARLEALELAKSDAKRHYDLLMASPDEARLLLVTPDELAVKYDVSITVQTVDISAKLDEIGVAPDVSKMMSVLKRSLSDRVSNMAVHSTEHPLTFRIGLILNPEECFRLVDLGPSVEDKPGCASFRSFWGDKSELRRFKDSSIKETAVWESLAKERHLIVGEICKYILARHMKGCETGVVCGQLDWAVEMGSFGPVISAFESLSKKIRGLSNLPLTITGCEAISPACRYTALSIPKPLSSFKAKQGLLPLPFQVHKVVVTIEASGKWPQDPHAASLLKQAFALQMSRCLVEEQHLECSFAKDFLDILCDDHVFRCYLTFAGELSLLSAHGIDVAKTAELIQARPKHARAIHSTYTSNVVYGPAVRLAKRFVNSQMMAQMISEELVELLMAHLFLHPARNGLPSSAWTAFLRFLQLIVEFDWEASPLVINFDRTTQFSKKVDVGRAFSQAQGKVCLFVAPSYDAFRMSTWSLPSSHTAAFTDFKRLTAAALKYLKSNPDNDLSVLFKRSPKAFSGVLELEDLASRSLSKRSQLVIKNGSLQADFLRFMPGFNPTSILLEELEQQFGDAAQFFYDEANGHVIGYKVHDSSTDVEELSEKMTKFCRDLICIN